jgi:hypothetical protein
MIKIILFIIIILSTDKINPLSKKNVASKYFTGNVFLFWYLLGLTNFSIIKFVFIGFVKTQEACMIS